MFYTRNRDGHEKATQAFVWARQDKDEPRYTAALNTPPINDPSNAVKAAIAAGVFH
ncbi:MAG: hypothetical protein ACPG6P_03755 [Akkermansiaceae bacterium]